MALVPVPHTISRTVFPDNNPASRTRISSALGTPESHGVSPVRYDSSNSPPLIESPRLSDAHRRTPIKRRGPPRKTRPRGPIMSVGFSRPRTRRKGSSRTEARSMLRRLNRFDLAPVVCHVALDHVALEQQPVKGIEHGADRVLDSASDDHRIARGQFALP